MNSHQNTVTKNNADKFNKAVVITCLTLIVILTLSVLPFSLPPAYAGSIPCDLIIVIFTGHGCTDPHIEIAAPPPVIERVVGFCTTFDEDVRQEFIDKGYAPRSIGLLKFPLYHYTNGVDHYYTIHPDDSGMAAKGYAPGFEGGGQVCNVADPRSTPAKADAERIGLRPLYRYWGPADHYYTLFLDDTFVRSTGTYHPDGQAGYVFREDTVGVFPLYRLITPEGYHILSIHPEDYYVLYDECEWIEC